MDGAELIRRASAAAGRAGERADLDPAVSGVPAERLYATTALAVNVAGMPTDLLELDATSPEIRVLRQFGGLRRVI